MLLFVCAGAWKAARTGGDQAKHMSKLETVKQAVLR